MAILEGKKVTILDSEKACKKVTILEDEKQPYQKVRNGLIRR